MEIYDDTQGLADPTELAAALGRCLRDRGQTVTTAESCTGGWIAKCLTDIPGSSSWFEVGLVTYADRAKTHLLGISDEAIARHGAVSETVVTAMAREARLRAAADWSIAVSGIAGPTGGTPGKPVGTVWMAWCGAEISWQRHAVFAGDRSAVRRAAVAVGLSELLARLET